MFSLTPRMGNEKSAFSLVTLQLVCIVPFSSAELGWDARYGEDGERGKSILSSESTFLPTVPLAVCLAYIILGSFYLPVTQLFALSLHTLEVTLKWVLVCELK